MLKGQIHLTIEPDKLNYFAILHKFLSVCDALSDLAPFVQFKKNVKNTHRGVLL